jgi:hypothetical protein
MRASLLALAACGRLRFDPIPDHRGDAAVSLGTIGLLTGPLTESGAVAVGCGPSNPPVICLEQ